MNNSTLELGSFEVTSGRLVVSDPCYKPGLWCVGELDRVKTGNWNATVEYSDEGDWGIRVARLIARHEDVDDLRKLDRLSATFGVGVDSGQAGFFDAAHFHDPTIILDAPSKTWSENDVWYDSCCEITLSKTQAGILPYGVVSASGYGDGCYDCNYYTDKLGNVVAAEIVFID